MIKAEKDILVHKKSEEISKKVIKKLWDNRQEFSPMLEQIILETLKESLEILSASHKEKNGQLFENREDLKSYQAHQIGRRFAEIIEQGDFPGLNVFEVNSCYSSEREQTRFIFVVK
jgi:hypothetical protein